MKLLDFLMRDRHEYHHQSAFAYAAAYLNPADWHHLQREVLASRELQARFGMTSRPSFDIDGTSVEAEVYVTPGWVVFLSHDQTPGRRIIQKQFRCLEHTDCRGSIELGLECWAEQRQSDGPEKGNGT